MYRSCIMIMVVGLALSASAAQGAFVSIEYVQGNSPAATTAMGQDAVTFRVYATFDGTGNGSINAVNRTQFVAITTVGVATFFHEANVGSNLPPDPFFFAPFPKLRYDTWATIGVSDGADPLAPSISDEPLNIMSDTLIAGGWFNLDPSNNAGAAVANSNLTSGFGTLLFQITVLTNGGTGAFLGPINPGFPLLASGGNASSVASLITGSFSVVEQGPNGPITHTISIPTPGALAMFSVAGLAALRRRR